MRTYMARVQQIKKEKGNRHKQLASRPARKSAYASGGVKRPIRISLAGLSFTLDAAVTVKNGWMQAYNDSLNIEKDQASAIQDTSLSDFGAIILAYEGTQYAIRQNIGVMMQRYTARIQQLSHIISTERTTVHPPQQLFPNRYRYNEKSILVVYDGSVTTDDRLSLLF